MGTSAVRCAKTAEPIDFRLGCGSGMPEEAQVQSYSPGGASVTTREAHWSHLTDTIEPSACSIVDECIKAASSAPRRKLTISSCLPYHRSIEVKLHAHSRVLIGMLAV